MEVATLVYIVHMHDTRWRLHKITLLAIENTCFTMYTVNNKIKIFSPS